MTDGTERLLRDLRLLDRLLAEKSSERPDARRRLEAILGGGFARRLLLGLTTDRAPRRAAAGER